MFVSSSSHLLFDIIYPVNQVGCRNKKILTEVNKENVMRKRPILETVVLSAALVFIPLVTRAALYGDSKIVAGIVKAVSDDSITVTENAADGSQGNDITLQAQSATQYPDIQLKDLKEGDRIRVEYHEDQNLKVADSVAKDDSQTSENMAQ